MYDASTQATTSLSLPSRTAALAEIKNLVALQIGMQLQAVAETDRLISDIGCDSLDIAEIAMQIEEKYGITMPDEYFEQDRTVGGVTDYLLHLLATDQGTRHPLDASSQ